ncbi:MAG TPA: hypothetical protein VM658_02395 [bacterium]|nr:hypothetical protein [bacterium]
MMHAIRFGEIQACLAKPPEVLSETLEQFGVPGRFGVHLMLRGQTLGMVLQLRRVEWRPPKAPVLSGHTLATGMQNKDRRRDLAACQQQGKGQMQGFDRPLENNYGFPGNQPARVIFKQRPLDAEPRSPHPGRVGQDSYEPTRQDREQGPRKTTEHRRRPRKPHRNRFGQRPSQNHRHHRAPNQAPAEGIPGLDLPRYALAHPRDAVTLPLQFPEGFMSFISFGEIADEDACFLHSP